MSLTSSISILTFNILTTLFQCYKTLEYIFLKPFQPLVKDKIIQILKPCGVEVNGPNPWDIQVHDEKFYLRAATEFTLGIGEAYLDRQWDCSDIPELTYRMIRNDQFHIETNRFSLNHIMNWFNLQDEERAWEVGRHHYDLGLELYEAMLDPHLVYSICYWKKGITNLNEAAEAKLDLVCRKLHLKPGMMVLDIGCGFGGLAKYMSTHYKVKVVGYTVSKDQAEYARKWCEGHPIEIRLADYRDLERGAEAEEKYDRVVSIEVIEHVGPKNYDNFLRIIRNKLTEDGLFLLSLNLYNHDRPIRYDPFVTKYLFPNICMPYYLDLMRAMENKFIIEDLQNVGLHYIQTIGAWMDNFQRNWEGKLRSKYGERFYRLWTVYWWTMVGLCKARGNQVWFLVLSKHGILVKEECEAAI